MAADIIPIELGLTAGNGLTATVTGRAIVNATVEVQLNAPGDNVTVNGRKVRLT